MKKCPQCGTILEETKKKCYMCGAELQKTSYGSFGDTFDDQIGANVSEGQDNVFNSIKSLISGASSSTGNDVTYSNSVNSAPQINTEFQNNVPGYDNRTAIEKIFTTDSRFRNNDDDFNAKPSDGNDFYQPPANNVLLTNTPPGPHNKKNFINEEAINKKIKEKPAVNWGDNLDGDKVEKKPAKFGLNVIFNIGSVVFFIVAVVFLYFKFLAPKDVEEKQKFAGLSYEISKDFTYKGESGPSRYYTYGAACALKINYGPTVDTSGFIDNYFEKVKNSNPESTTKVSDIKVNGNVWTEISVLDFEQNAAAANGYAEVLKYKYVAIVHKGNYFDIVFANDNDDSKCASMFDKFMESLELE